MIKQKKEEDEEEFKLEVKLNNPESEFIGKTGDESFFLYKPLYDNRVKVGFDWNKYN
jgi:hypothetical protein